EVRADHPQPRSHQAPSPLVTDQGAVRGHGDVDPEVRTMADVFLEPLVQQGLAITVQRDDAHIEARAEVGTDALEILEGHDPAPIDEVMLLIALRAVDAPEIARIDGF